MADTSTQTPGSPPPGPPVPWRQHFRHLWQQGLRDDLIRTATVVAIPVAIGGLTWGAKKLWDAWQRRRS